jgi:hypothetical protein
VRRSPTGLPITALFLCLCVPSTILSLSFTGLDDYQQPCVCVCGRLLRKRRSRPNWRCSRHRPADGNR